MKKERESGLELLRILLIFGVIILHYNGNFALNLVTADSGNEYLLNLLETLSICAVDTFVLISGFFLCRSGARSLGKGLALVAEVMVLGLIKSLIRMGSSGFSLFSLIGGTLPNNYYVTLYLAVYFLSPYLNLALSKLSEKQFQFLTLLCLGLFSLWTTVLDLFQNVTGMALSGMYPTNLDGSQFGYSLVQFLLMYLLGAYLYRSKKEYKPSYLVLTAIISMVVLFFWSLRYPGTGRSYCNPFVILLSCSVFLLFQNLHFSSNIINALAKGVFTCFLFHDLLLEYADISKVVNGNTLILLAHILVSALGIFLICWLVWRVYSWITNPLFRWLSHKLERADCCLSIPEGKV